MTAKKKSEMIIKNDFDYSAVSQPILENNLELDNEKKTNSLDVLRELFSKHNIETKTELDINQIVLINQKRTISKLLDWKDLDNVLIDFMRLLVSKNRKGRLEFIEGLQGERQKEIAEKQGIFNKFNPLSK